MHLYESIADTIRAKIRCGQYQAGAQLPTEVELARIFRVNRITLRHALDILQSEGLIRRERGKGTFVERRQSAVNGISRILYLGDFQGHLFKDFYLAAMAECQRMGLNLIPFNPACDSKDDVVQRHLLELLRDSHALIITPGGDAVIASCAPETFAALRRVIVFHSAFKPSLPAYHVFLDSNHAAMVATEHLIKLGHRRLAYIGVHPATPPTPASPFPEPLPDAAPYTGFLTALQKSGISEHRAFGTYASDAESEKKMGDFLSHLSGWATAIVCDMDYRALCLFHAATRLGIRIPEQLSIVGIGDTPWSEAVRPRLTTVSFHEHEAAALAVHLCLLSPPQEPIVVSVQTQLKAKGSTAAHSEVPPARS